MTKPNKLSLADADKLIATHTSDNMRDRVLAFIIQYQDQHTGNTPAIDLIARHLDTAPQAVRAMLGRLEAARKVHIISRNPLRVVVMQRDTLLPHEEADNAKTHDPERYSRLLEADGTRHGLARWIGQHNEAFGRGPTLRDAMTYLNLTNGGWVNRQLEILAERGLIQYGTGKNTELTEQGRTFYRVAPTKPTVVVVPIQPKEEAMHDKTEAPARARETYQETLARRAKSPSTMAWADRIGHAIYDYQNAHRGASPEYKDLREAMGLNNDTTIAVALTALENDGLIWPRHKSSKRNVFLTDAGKQRFGPAPVAEPEPEYREPHTEDAVSDKLPPEKVPPFMGRIERVPTFPPPPPTPQEWFGVDAVPDGLSNVATADLIMELIERGYTVKR